MLFDWFLKGAENCMISEFRGKYYFLSNFYSSPVYYRGMTFQNAEAAFHSQKDLARAAEFTRLNPSEAKRLGRRVRLRCDWEDVKDGIMFEVVMAKFGGSQTLTDALLATGNKKLVEGNTWGDRYWGVCDGRGLNKLGDILERVRENLRMLRAESKA